MTSFIRWVVRGVLSPKSVGAHHPYFVLDRPVPPGDPFTSRHNRIASRVGHRIRDEDIRCVQQGIGDVDDCAHGRARESHPSRIRMEIFVSGVPRFQDPCSVCNRRLEVVEDTASERRDHCLLSGHECAVMPRPHGPGVWWEWHSEPVANLIYRVVRETRVPRLDSDHLRFSAEPFELLQLGGDFVERHGAQFPLQIARVGTPSADSGSGTDRNCRSDSGAETWQVVSKEA